MRQRGFTLLEVLVVLVIVALAAGLLIAGRGLSPGLHLSEETQRLRETLQLAADKAILGGIEHGLVVTTRGYAFVVFDAEEREWRLLQQRPLEAHALPSGYRLRLELAQGSMDELPADLTMSGAEGAAVEIDEIMNADGGHGGRVGNDLLPSVLLLSNGELTPFRLHLLAPAGAHREVWSDGLQLYLRAEP